MRKIDRKQQPILPPLSAASTIGSQVDNNTPARAQNTDDIARRLASKFEIKYKGFINEDLPQVTAMLAYLSDQTNVDRLEFVAENFKATMDAISTVSRYQACQVTQRQELERQAITVIENWLERAEARLDQKQTALIENHHSTMATCLKEALSYGVVAVIDKERSIDLNKNLTEKLDALELKWIEVVGEIERESAQSADQLKKQQAQQRLQAASNAVSKLEELSTQSDFDSVHKDLATCRSTVTSLSPDEHVSEHEIRLVQTRLTKVQKVLDEHILSLEELTRSQIKQLEEELGANKNKVNAKKLLTKVTTNYDKLARLSTADCIPELAEQIQKLKTSVDQLPDQSRTEVRPTEAQARSSKEVLRDVTNAFKKFTTAFTDRYNQATSKSLNAKKKIILASGLKTEIDTLEKKLKELMQVEVQDQESETITRARQFTETLLEITTSLKEFLTQMQERWSNPSKPRVIQSDEAKKGAKLALSLKTLGTLSTEISENEALKAVVKLQSTVMSLFDIRVGAFAEKSSSMVDNSRGADPLRAAASVLGLDGGKGRFPLFDLIETSPFRPQVSRPRAPENYQKLKGFFEAALDRDADLFHQLRKHYTQNKTQNIEIDTSAIDTDLNRLKASKANHNVMIDLLKKQKAFYQELQKAINDPASAGESAFREAGGDYFGYQQGLFQQFILASDKQEVEAKMLLSQFVFSHFNALSSTENFEELASVYKEFFALEQALSLIPCVDDTKNLVPEFIDKPLVDERKLTATDPEDLLSVHESQLGKREALLERAEEISDSVSREKFKSVVEASAKALNARVKILKDLTEQEVLTSDEQKKVYDELNEALKAARGADFSKLPRAFALAMNDSVRTADMNIGGGSSDEPESAEDFMLKLSTLPGYLKVITKQLFEFTMFFHMIQKGVDPLQSLNSSDNLSQHPNALKEEGLKRAKSLLNRISITLGFYYETFSERGDFSKSERGRLTGELIQYQKKSADIQLRLIDFLENFNGEIGKNSDSKTNPNDEQIKSYEQVIQDERIRILCDDRVNEIIHEPFMPYNMKKLFQTLPVIQAEFSFKVRDEIAELKKSGKTTQELLEEFGAKV